MDKSKGLGDSVEKLARRTKIKNLVKRLAKGKDCGCKKRQNKLNKMFPYKNENI
jgi:hypothetical protein|tara:strand:- start:3297 stop:3458 length:162 start_codon:yes stop_codon:yes gene_type:complete